MAQYDPRVEQEMAAKYNAAKEFNETACVDPQYLNHGGLVGSQSEYKQRYFPTILEKLEKENYSIKDILNRREKVQELTSLLSQNPDIARILDLMRELGL